MRLDTVEMRSFLAVVRTGSVSAAAALLNVSVSALSRRVARVEAQACCTLFDRSGSSLVPTRAGRLLAGRLAPLLDGVLDAVREAQQQAAARSELRLVAVAPAARRLVPAASARLLRDHPRLRVAIADASAEEVQAAVLAGTAALGVGYQSEPRHPLIFEPLVRDPFVLLCPAGHRLATRRSVAWRELEGEVIFGLLPGGTEQHGTPDDALRTGRRHGLDARLQHSGTVLGLVEAGLGLAILPLSATPARRGRTSPALLREPALAQVIGAWTRADQKEDPVLTALRSHLRAEASPAPGSRR